MYYDTAIELDIALLYQSWRRKSNGNESQELLLLDVSDDPMAVCEIADRDELEEEYPRSDGLSHAEYLTRLDSRRPGTIAGLATAARKWIEEHLCG